MVSFFAFFVYLARSVAEVPKSLARKAVEKSEVQIDVVSVVNQVRQLSRLETVSMTVTHVSTIKQSYGVIPNALAGDELTLLAVGEVIGGVDLSRVQPGDAWVEPGRVLVLRLPSPQILVSRLDNRKTRVVNRDTGVLRKSDVNLESRARQAAEQAVRREALKNGVLEKAREGAEQQLSRFFHTLGIDRVRFISSPAPSGRAH